VLDSAYERFCANLDIRREMDRLLHKTMETRAVVKKKLEEFISTLEKAKTVEKDIIQPFLDDKLAEKDVDMERLLEIERSWLSLCDTLTDDRNFYEITVMTLQAYDVWLSCELSFLKDIYTNPKIISMARVRKMTEWFSVISSFLLFTEIVLRNAEEKMKKEMAS
jgi:hypothetical protein